MRVMFMVGRYVRRKSRISMFAYHAKKHHLVLARCNMPAAKYSSKSMVWNAIRSPLQPIKNKGSIGCTMIELLLLSDESNRVGQSKADACATSRCQAPQAKRRPDNCCEWQVQY